MINLYVRTIVFRFQLLICLYKSEIHLVAKLLCTGISGFGRPVRDHYFCMNKIRRYEKFFHCSLDLSCIQKISMVWRLVWFRKTLRPEAGWPAQHRVSWPMVVLITTDSPVAVVSHIVYATSGQSTMAVPLHWMPFRAGLPVFPDGMEILYWGSLIIGWKRQQPAG